MNSYNTAAIKPWLIWLTAGLFYLYEFIHRVAPSVMIPELSESFGVSAAAIGSISAYYYYAYASVQIPVGMLLDKYGCKILLTIAACLVAIGSWMFPVFDTIAMAKFARILIGLGSAVAFISCLKLATTWFPVQRFALIIGLTNLLGVIGAILGGKPLANLVDTSGWRYTLFLSAFIGVCFAIILPFIIRDKPSATNIKAQAILKQLSSILKNKTLWAQAILATLMVAPVASLSELWEVSYLVKKINISRPDAAEISSVTFAGIALGGPIIGWLSDLLNARRQVMLVGAFISLLASASILYLPIKSIVLLSVAHFIFGFATSSMLLCFAVSVTMVPEYSKATAIGFINTIVVAGSAIFQPLIGVMIDKLNIIRPEATVLNYQVALSSLIVCQISAIILLLVPSTCNCSESLPSEKV